MNEQSTFKLGAEAANLLYSLRAFEAARDYYFQALEGFFGEAGASEKYSRETPTWEAAEDLIEKALMDHFRDWACESNLRDTI